MYKPTALVILTTALLIGGNASAATSIGRVIYANGDIQAENNGQVRKLRRGSYIQEGDNVITSRASRSQLRMTDGALFALRPNTKMSFENYRFNKESRKGSSILSLIKGGFRTITGLIGRFNKKDYSVRTSVATIGVRGTHFGLTLCQQNDCVDNGNGFEDGLYGSVVDGEIVAQNEAGEFHFSNDEYFHVNSATDKPRSLLKPPGIIFDQAKFTRSKQVREKIRETLKQNAALQNIIETRQDYIRNQVEHAVFESGLDSDSNINLIKAPDGSAAVFGFFGAATDPQTGAPFVFGVADKVTADDATNNNVVLNASASSFLPVLLESNTGANNKVLALGLAKPLDLDSTKIGNTRVGWGRWSAPYLAAVDGVPQAHQGTLHYAFADSTTTLPQLASLKVAAAYQSIDGTRPTDLAGNQAQSFADVQIQADFGQETLDYSVSTTVNGTDYTASGFAVGTGAIQNVVVNGIVLNDTSNIITGGVNTATGTASVAFIGDTAQGAISSFELQHDTATLPDGVTPNRVTGTAVLTQGGALPAAPQQ